MEFLIVEFVVFGGSGAIAFSMASGRRSRLILSFGTVMLWVGCAYCGLLLWLNIYGS